MNKEELLKLKRTIIEINKQISKYNKELSDFEQEICLLDHKKDNLFKQKQVANDFKLNFKNKTIGKIFLFFIVGTIQYSMIYFFAPTIIKYCSYLFFILLSESCATMFIGLDYLNMCKLLKKDFDYEISRLNERIKEKEKNKSIINDYILTKTKELEFLVKENDNKREFNKQSSLVYEEKDKIKKFKKQ